MDSENLDLDENLGEKQAVFMNIISEYPILLNKSQLPAVKIKKEKHSMDAIKKIKEILGLTLDSKGLSKKLSRMKAEVKSKIDMNRTGNKKIVLKVWEKQMADIIQAETNPSISKVPGAISFGPKARHIIVDENVSPDFQSNPKSYSELIPPAPVPKRKNNGDQFEKESEETRGLSNSQLQRLVLLEQLEVLRLKKQRLLVPSTSVLNPVFENTTNSNVWPCDEWSSNF